jgi:CheY-like chemotaxis protein
LDNNSPARPVVERIEAMAIQASRIVRQILTYTRQDNQELEAVDVAQVVWEMLHLLRSCVPKTTRFHVELPQSLPIARGNAIQLQQVLMNLVLNAGEAMIEGGGLITISGKFARAFDSRRRMIFDALPSDKYVSLEISDNGAGITDAVRERIFEPFFSTKLPGRGLGLAAVERIIRNHGGAIGFSTGPGDGTTFEILLPCETMLPRGRETAPHQEEPMVGRGSVLVVEDEETLRASVSMMFRKSGFPVLEAADGDLAIALIRDRSAEIGVVLLDLTLPGKSSQEVFEELRRARPGVKVILTSAYGRESVQGPLRAVERDNFIRKPYRLSELLSVVCQALEAEGVAHNGQSDGAK